MQQFTSCQLGPTEVVKHATSKRGHQVALVIDRCVGYPGRAYYLMVIVGPAGNGHDPKGTVYRHTYAYDAKTALKNFYTALTY